VTEPNTPPQMAVPVRSATEPLPGASMVNVRTEQGAPPGTVMLHAVGQVVPLLSWHAAEQLSATKPPPVTYEHALCTPKPAPPDSGG